MDLTTQDCTLPTFLSKLPFEKRGIKDGQTNEVHIFPVQYGSLEIRALEPNTQYSPSVSDHFDAHLLILQGHGSIIIGEMSYIYFRLKQFNVTRGTPHSFRTDNRKTYLLCWQGNFIYNE